MSTTISAGESGSICRTNKIVSQVFISLLVSTTLLVTSKYLPSWAKYCASPVMLLVVLLARGYIKNFWAPQKDEKGKDKGKKAPPLPNLEDYNVAVTHTEKLLEGLEYLEYSWLISSFVAGIVGYS